MRKTIDSKLWDKKMEKDHGIDMQRTLHLIKNHDMVGEMIAQAQARGEFDNLQGAGQPLMLEDNPYAPPELHMAYKILKDAGFAPYWIELGKEIDALHSKYVLEVDYFKRYTRSLFCEKCSPRMVSHYERRKERFYAQSHERLSEVSKKILDYNLHCPVRQLGKANFDVEEEMKHLVQEIEELVPAVTWKLPLGRSVRLLKGRIFPFQQVIGFHSQSITIGQKNLFDISLILFGHLDVCHYFLHISYPKFFIFEGNAKGAAIMRTPYSTLQYITAGFTRWPDVRAFISRICAS